MIGAFYRLRHRIFGPLIFTPGASQGPLLSIFVAPAGALLGALAGDFRAVLWSTEWVQIDPAVGLLRLVCDRTSSKRPKGGQNRSWHYHC